MKNRKTSAINWLGETKSNHRRSRFLAWMLIILMLLFAGVIISVIALQLDNHLLYTAMVSGLIAIIALAYYLNRVGHYYWSAGLAVVASFAGPVGSMLFDPGVRHGDFMPVIYGALVVYLSGFLLPPLFTILIAVLQWLIIIYVVSTGFFAASFNWPSFLIFIFFSAVLSIFSSILTQRDIEELEVRQKATEDARRFSENIINNLREPLISLDQDYRVVSVNRSFYDFFRVRPDETVGQLVYHLDNNQWDIPQLRELLETILPEKATYNGYELEHDFSAIGKRTMLVNARQIMQEVDRKQIILLAIEDITERKKAEKRTFETALERERTAILTKFISDASHEFRTPLSLIQTNIYLLSRLEDPNKRQIKLTQINDQVDGIGRLVDLLAETAQFEGQDLFNAYPIDLNVLIGAVVGEMPDPAAKGLSLHLDLVSDRVVVLADGHWLQRAVDELLGNAIRFTPSGGRISVRTTTNGDCVTTMVQDTGPGIAPDGLPHIFKRFYRQDVAHTTPGFGLGLPLAKAIIEYYEGHIWVASTPGVGSTFFFTLPLA